VDDNQAVRLLIVCLLALAPTHAWLTGWDYRKPIEVNTTTNLTDYQIALNITYDSDMNTDFSDIRFTDTNDNLLPYWIEDKVDSSWAYVWVKGNWTTNNGTQLYLYYGNSEATSESNATTTMSFYDDFDDNDISDWTIADGSFTVTNGYLENGDSNTDDLIYKPFSHGIGYRYYTRVNAVSPIDNYCSLGFLPSTSNTAGWSADGDKYRMGIYWNDSVPFGSKIGVWRVEGGSITDTILNPTISLTAGNWYKLTGTTLSNGTIITHILSESTGEEDTISFDDTSPLTSFNYMGLTYTDDTVKTDYIYVAKYTSPEPTYSIGAEEAQSGISTSILTPTSITYYSETLTANVSLYWLETSSNSSTNYSFEAKLDGASVYNTTGTIDHQQTIYLTFPLSLYEDSHTLTAEVNATDFNKTNSDSVSFSVSLYDLNITYPPSNGLWLDTPNITINFTCWRDSSKSVKLYLADNSTITENRTEYCGGSRLLYWPYQSDYEGKRNITITLVPYDTANENNHTDSFWYYSDTQYPNVNLTYSLTYGFGTEVEENATYQASDTASFSLNCTYEFGETSGYDEIANTSYGNNYTYIFNLTAGWNNLYVNCTDLANHTTQQSQQFSTYVFKVLPRDEETDVYDTSLWQDTITNTTAFFRFIAVDKEFNESYIYENITPTIYLVLNTSKSWIFRMEEQFESQVIINYIDTDYAPSEIKMCVSPDVPNILQTASSSIPLPNYGFAITRTETGCVRALLSTESQYTQSGYGFYFYTQPGLYAVWSMSKSGWENKTALVSFSGEQQLVLDLEKILLMTTQYDLSRNRVGIPNIYRARGQNATYFTFLADDSISTFSLGIKKDTESNWLLNVTETNAGTSVSYLVTWDTIGVEKSDVLNWCYTVKLEDGRTYSDCITATPEGRNVKFKWWMTAIILTVPVLILFYRQFSTSNIVVMSMMVLGAAAILIPMTEPHWVIQLIGYGLAMAFIFVLFILIGLVK